MKIPIIYIRKTLLDNSIYLVCFYNIFNRKYLKLGRVNTNGGIAKASRQQQLASSWPGRVVGSDCT